MSHIFSTSFSPSIRWVAFIFLNITLTCVPLPLPLPQTCPSSPPGLSCGRCRPSRWSAVFLSTSSSTWSASSPLRATPSSPPDSSPFLVFCTSSFRRFRRALLTSSTFLLSRWPMSATPPPSCGISASNWLDVNFWGNLVGFCHFKP